MSQETNQYTIVLIGDMNPSIQHPAWYEAVGLIDADEYTASVSNNPITTPELSQFSIADFKVRCMRHQFIIESDSVDQLQRMRGIVGQIFDELLKHTPVRQFGLNFNFKRKTKVSVVGSVLAKELLNTRIGLNPNRPFSAQIKYRRRMDNHVVNIDVQPQPPPDADYVLVSNNYHFEIDNLTSETQYALGPLIENFFESSLSDAVQNTRSIIESISAIPAE